MVLTRAIGIFALSNLYNGFSNAEIPLREQVVLWWGGLRGSVAIALALSVPIALPQRQEIIATVFGVVLFTLLVQGLTIKPLLVKLGLLSDQVQRQDYLEAIARRVALKRVLEYMEQTDPLRPEINPEYFRYQKVLLQGQLDDLETEIQQLQKDYPELQEFIVAQFQQELLAIEADTYAEFVRSGRLNQELAPFLQDVLATEA